MMVRPRTCRRATAMRHWGADLAAPRHPSVGWSSECFPTTLALSRNQYWMWFHHRVLSPAKVITALKREGLRFVLVGLYGLSGWLKEPRATGDLDVLVMPRDARRAARIARELHPDLVVRDTPFALRLFRGRFIVLDLIKASRPLFHMVFRNTTRVRIGRLTVAVPSVEMALALKFAGVKSSQRGWAERHQDAHDLMLLALNNPGLRMDKVREFGSLAAAHGETRLTRIVEDTLAGRKPRMWRRSAREPLTTDH